MENFLFTLGGEDFENISFNMILIEKRKEKSANFLTPVGWTTVWYFEHNSVYIDLIE